MKRDRFFKGGMNALGHGKLTVAAFVMGSQPVVELRSVEPDGRGFAVDLSLPQACEAVRLLSLAIEAASGRTRHDGPSLPCSAAREAAGRVDHHDGQENAG